VILVSRILETKLAEFPHHQLIEIHEIHQISVHTVLAPSPSNRRKSFHRSDGIQPSSKRGCVGESGYLLHHVRGLVSVPLHRGSSPSDYRVALQAVLHEMHHDIRWRILRVRFRRSHLIL